MNTIQAVILGTAISTCAYAQELPIIPKPVQSKVTDASFAISKETAIRYDAKLSGEAELLASALKKTTGAKPKLVKEELKIMLPSEIYLDLSDKKEPKEGYQLTVTPKQIKITGNDAAGAFYGVQSLLQIINEDKTVPGCNISDQPRFGWRGMHLDVGRHMFAPEDIKKFIDWLAIHKLNTFHWHLTEDQGWRVEIKKYPKLTTVGAYRASTPPYGNRGGSDGKRYGGFYTQEQIKEIVAYAKQRHITIVPEIDMPGHMAAAIAAYPELGNDDIPNYNPEVKCHWGVHPYVLAPKEETFQWVDDVLTEICELFPSSYIHIGGDEAPKGQWKQSKFAQSVIKREGLKDEHELQSYFIKRVEKMLENKGRKLIGWDEIREGGLSPNATMMLWRGWGHAVASINEGHDVVMAPGSHTYFDHYQHTPAAILSQGPEYEAIGGHRTIESVYSFNPIPKEFQGKEKAKHVLGCQAQLWTEYMKTWDKVEYRAFPRIAALAEVAWSPQESRNFEDFMKRLKPMMARYKKAGVNAFDVFNPPVIKAKNGMKAETSLPTHGGNDKIFAIDGNLKTRFWSSKPPKKGDHFTVTFPKATSSTAKVKVLTGETDGGKDHLENGELEAKGSNNEWKSLGAFKGGMFNGTLPKGSTALRIKATGNQGTWLIIREVEISK
ncbi:family 20 glycosylhydrolase [Verrucomicrobiaceae bacterium N1E253]|uniref:beta-N-acetylhexosaminidase n=1 Tax=Oceaniferula marina TaxID=2748318 RepID=A0A851GM71_9BACT|nr:family 20 glycosylhydrolase [Oceaniferula marina]NWK56931.1 family 20 glycosylhydrolase [Oceaniferula marina]